MFKMFSGNSSEKKSTADEIMQSYLEEKSPDSYTWPLKTHSSQVLHIIKPTNLRRIMLDKKVEEKTGDLKNIAEQYPACRQLIQNDIKMLLTIAIVTRRADMAAYLLQEFSIDLSKRNIEIGDRENSNFPIRFTPLGLIIFILEFGNNVPQASEIAISLLLHSEGCIEETERHAIDPFHSTLMDPIIDHRKTLNALITYHYLMLAAKSHHKENKEDFHENIKTACKQEGDFLIQYFEFNAENYQRKVKDKNLVNFFLAVIQFLSNNAEFKEVYDKLKISIEKLAPLLEKDVQREKAASYQAPSCQTR